MRFARRRAGADGVGVGVGAAKTATLGAVGGEDASFGVAEVGCLTTRLRLLRRPRHS